VARGSRNASYRRKQREHSMPVDDAQDKKNVSLNQQMKALRELR